MAEKKGSRRLSRRFHITAEDRIYTRRDAKAYDEFARTGYYDHSGDAISYRRHVREILGEIGENSGRGLELGAGTMLFSRELAKLGIPMDGVDKSEGMVHQYALQQKEGHGQDLRLFQQDCVEMETGQYYNHVGSHGYQMFIFDPEADDWVLTSYTEGLENNYMVFERTAKHLRPGSSFLINVFPFGGDYNLPRKLSLKDGKHYKSELMRINGSTVRKHHSIIGSNGNKEWEKVFLRSKFSRSSAENALVRAGFEIEGEGLGFDDIKNPKWFVARKTI